MTSNFLLLSSCHLTWGQIFSWQNFSISHEARGATSSTSTQLEIIDLAAVLSLREEETQTCEIFILIILSLNISVKCSLTVTMWWHAKSLLNLQINLQGKTVLNYSHKILKFCFCILVHLNFCSLENGDAIWTGSDTLSCTDDTEHWHSPALSQGIGDENRCSSVWESASSRAGFSGSSSYSKNISEFKRPLPYFWISFAMLLLTKKRKKKIKNVNLFLMTKNKKLVIFQCPCLSEFLSHQDWC